MISTAELANKEFTGLDLPQPYRNFLGEIPTDSAMSVWGPPGSGKSTWALDFALVLADMLGNGIYCSSEEGPGPSLQNKIKRLGAEHDNLLVDDFDTFDNLKAKLDISNGQFVVIDSISKSRITVSDFQDFLEWCKSHDVISIYILHTTKDGTYKGPTEYIHDPDIEIYVSPEGVAEIHNKNRYLETPREMEIAFEKRQDSEVRSQESEGSSQPSDVSRQNPHENIKQEFYDWAYNQQGITPQAVTLKTWLSRNYPELEEQYQQLWDEFSKTSNRENPATDESCVVSVQAKTNEQKNGIEIQFSDAPPEFVRSQLMDAGFTFYNPNNGESFWAAEKTAQRKEIAEEIAGEFDQAVVNWKPKEKDGKSETADDKRKEDLSDVDESDLSSSNASNASKGSYSKPDVDFVLGKETTVDFKADGYIQEKGHFAVMDVADIIPSHNKDCSVNSDHNISKGQPRDRSLDALCNQPKFIAQNLNPTSITRGNLAFNGASTLLPDGQVIQGNGRGIALKIAVDEHQENYQEYKDYIINNASDWGLSKEEMQQFEHPALVRMLDVSNDRAIELGNVVDTSQAKMSKVDQGKAYIRNLPKERKQVIGNLIDKSTGETLGQVIDDVGLQIMDQFEDLDRQGLVEDNSLTSDGKDFLRSVFAGLVFDSDENPDALQHFLNLKHRQQAGIKRSYGNIIPFLETDADITPTLQKAVKIADKVQHKDGIDTVQDFIGQSGMFSGANTNKFSKQEAQLAEFLLDADTQKFIRNGFRMYQFKINGKEDLFDPIEEVSPQQAFEDAFVERVRLNPDGEQVALQPASAFGTGDVIRDFYHTDKYEVVDTKGDTFTIKNIRTGRKQEIGKDVKRFVPDREETPTMNLFRDNAAGEEMVYLGICKKLTMDGNSGELEGAFLMCSNQDQDTLYIIPQHRIKQVDGLADDPKADELFAEFHNYQADDTDYEVSWPDDPSKAKVGTADVMFYLSDKIMRDGDHKGDNNLYRHEFDTGQRPVSVMGDIVVIENIEWNERGILN